MDVRVRDSDSDRWIRGKCEEDEPSADGDEYDATEPLHGRPRRSHRFERRRANSTDNERRRHKQNDENRGRKGESRDSRRRADGKGLGCQTDKQRPRSPESRK